VTDKTHMTFGGSSAHRWLRCPGSIKLCATLPPQPPNQYMEAGTRAHALLELALSEQRDSVTEFSGRSLKTGDPDFTDEDTNAVQIAVDYVASIMARDPNAIIFVERQVALSDDVGGTADVVIYLPSSQTLYVIDYKHGRKLVEAQDNPQLKMYAAATMFGFTEGLVQAIHAVIVQPLSPWGEPVRSCVYGPADLLTYSDDVDAAVAAARGENPGFVPGSEQCHWCPAAHVCPTRQGIDEMTVVAMSALTVNDDTVTLTLPSPASCRDPYHLAQALQAAEVMQRWIDGIESAALSVASSGAPLPRFKLVEKRPSRKWTDPDKAKAWFASDTMLDEDNYAPRKLLSVAQAEKLAKASGGISLVQQMASHVTKENSGLKLVPETAKGDAVNPLVIAVADFSRAITIEQGKPKCLTRE
jgi:hypothetical protein